MLGRLIRNALILLVLFAAWLAYERSQARAQCAESGGVMVDGLCEVLRDG